jgi:aryl-phospho-beta-D-glucosidase BglC (GH1 family)
VSWFGLDSPCRAPEGLKHTTVAAYLDFLASQRFNAVRLPISCSLALDLDGPAAKDVGDETIR